MQQKQLEWKSLFMARTAGCVRDRASPHFSQTSEKTTEEKRKSAERRYDAGSVRRSTNSSALQSKNEVSARTRDEKNFHHMKPKINLTSRSSLPLFLLLGS